MSDSEDIETLKRERDLFRKKAHDWNAEADKYLAQRDALLVDVDALVEEWQTSSSEIVRNCATRLAELFKQHRVS